VFPSFSFSLDASLYSSDSLLLRCAPLWLTKGQRAREQATGEHVAFDTPSRRSSRPRLEVWIIGSEERRPLSNGIRAWRQQHPVGGREKRNPQIYLQTRAHECSRSLSPGMKKEKPRKMNRRKKDVQRYQTFPKDPTVGLIITIWWITDYPWISCVE